MPFRGKRGGIGAREVVGRGLGCVSVEIVQDVPCDVSSGKKPRGNLCVKKFAKSCSKNIVFNA